MIDIVVLIGNKYADNDDDDDDSVPLHIGTSPGQLPLVQSRVLLVPP